MAVRPAGSHERAAGTGKESTTYQIRIAADNLIDFFGTARAIGEITEGDAEDFRRDLEKKGLATNTIRRRIGRAKQIFASAIKHKLIKDNPFKKEICSVGANEERMVFVPQDATEHLIRSLDCEDLKIIVALARYGGLRRHECLTQKWEDVDLINGRMIVRSDKTPPIRSCPIFAELRPHLLRAKEMAPEGAVRLQNRYHLKANPSTTLVKKIREAGLKPWPKTLQNLRASRESELMARYPAKDVTSWIGNSPQIAFKHYAMTLSDSFAKAIAEGVTPHRTPQLAPQTPQDTAPQVKTDKIAEASEDAIDCGKDVISLDLSVVGGFASLTQNAPTRTRT